MRCALCGEPVEIDDDDAVVVHGGGLAHESCLADYDDVECSAIELDRQRRQAARRRKAG
jgi:hypothetical protein